MADSPVSQLLRDAERIDATQTRLVLRFARELARVLRDVERQLPGLLERAQGTADQVRLSQLAHGYVETRAILRRAGYDGLVRATATSVMANDIAARVLSTSTGRAIAEFVNVGDQVRGLQDLMRIRWVREGDKAATSIWGAVIDAAIGGVRPSRLAITVARELGRSERQARSVVDTAISIYSRRVEHTLGSAPTDAYLYLGPADAVAREFCLSRVGKVYTRRAIDEMDNGQIAGVFTSGGGFNCRHRWMKVSRFSELQDLADTGQRVPEIAAQLKRVRKAA